MQGNMVTWIKHCQNLTKKSLPCPFKDRVLHVRNMGVGCSAFLLYYFSRSCSMCGIRRRGVRAIFVMQVPGEEYIFSLGAICMWIVEPLFERINLGLYIGWGSGLVGER